MLHLETVEPNTFSILKQINEIDIFHNFSLVEGTALSLKFGHRISIDLDFFSTDKFLNADIIKVLKEVFGDKFEYEPSSNEHFGIFCYIDKVKIDIVRFPHERIAPIEIIDNIRFYNNQDIAAMKIQAILGRGKKKDFWDLAELLKHYSLEDIINWHKQKYKGQILAIGIPTALTYFDDADSSENPICLQGHTWQQIKRDISQKVNDFLK